MEWLTKTRYPGQRSSRFQLQSNQWSHNNDAWVHILFEGSFLIFVGSLCFVSSRNLLQIWNTCLGSYPFWRSVLNFVEYLCLYEKLLEIKNSNCLMKLLLHDMKIRRLLQKDFDPVVQGSRVANWTLFFYPNFPFKGLSTFCHPWTNFGLEVKG